MKNELRGVLLLLVVVGAGAWEWGRCHWMERHSLDVDTLSQLEKPGWLLYEKTGDFEQFTAGLTTFQASQQSASEVLLRFLEVEGVGEIEEMRLDCEFAEQGSLCSVQEGRGGAVQLLPRSLVSDGVLILHHCTQSNWWLFYTHISSVAVFLEQDRSISDNKVEALLQVVLPMLEHSG